MTRQDAIYQIKNLAVLSSEKDMASITEALNMAIEALEQETVSRETYDHEFNLRKEFEMKVFELEKKITEQEPKRGEWIHGKEVSREYIRDACVGVKYEDWRCSFCKIKVEEPHKPNWNYCPNCGADMRGDEE